MDSLSHLLTLLAPRCEVNLHCRFGGRWQAGHEQMRSGIVPWHFVLRGRGVLPWATKPGICEREMPFCCRTVRRI